MSTPQEQFRQFLESQRADYRHALPARLQQLQALWTAIDAGAAAPPLGELERLAHTLAGTAGTFGLREVGQAARALEALLAQAGEGGGPLTPGQRAEISRAVAALQDSPRD
ncbi:MAG: Hpt domain-containing protein [Comamonadaceae bacterium]|nr:MAG: Hpt domain-containing protein [Comamonadaceae bacterium]